MRTRHGCGVGLGWRGYKWLSLCREVTNQRRPCALSSRSKADKSQPKLWLHALPCLNNFKRLTQRYIYLGSQDCFYFFFIEWVRLLGAHTMMISKIKTNDFKECTHLSAVSHVGHQRLIWGFGRLWDVYSRGILSKKKQRVILRHFHTEVMNHWTDHTSYSY